MRVLHILSVEHYVSQCNESFAVDVLRFEEIIIIVVNQAAGGRPALASFTSAQDCSYGYHSQRRWVFCMQFPVSIVGLTIFFPSCQ